ncbi:putative ABC transport system ATP-binding protein [Micromonospora violae]|uniref:Putative ABC transport system ATP-binding protein n=1 Tax=Micromonospora violae TaxID=1278207 RepID=A0A4Q7UIN4_9ACTN|nr:ABC transporter ATP-binding protein [Micromonospora violae]RZT81297.1 putative ABC transport system ATP-binding protein [Micromonospora violae]
MTEPAVSGPHDGRVPAIEAVDVSRTYQLDGVSVQALRGVSLTVQAGDYVALVGPSGSGKSTLMHLLGALDRPTGGRLVIGGRDVNALAPPEMATLRNETIGFVFQAFHLLPRTSAVENVALPLVYRGVSARQRRERAAAMLGRVGLGHRLDHRPNQMSGGEQQRVAIARALVTEPTVLLADEPTGNLDSVTGAAVLELLEQLNAESGVALVMVTHDQEVAARAQRRITMRDGVVVADSAASPHPPVTASADPRAAHDRPPSVDHGRPATLVPAPSAEPRSASGSGPGHPSGGSGGATGATGRLPSEVERSDTDPRDAAPGEARDVAAGERAADQPGGTA